MPRERADFSYGLLRVRLAGRPVRARLPRFRQGGQVVDLGIVVFNEYGVKPAHLALAVEQRGFESLFYPEHTHIPVATTRADDSPARGYAGTYDPFVALSAAAAVTTTLLVGTAVCLVTQRDPIITAKEVASIDLLSDGRFLFGIGAGWNREEMRNHQVEPRTRMRYMAEQVHAMRAIWSQDEAEYHGSFINFDPIWSWPKPIRGGAVPVLVGGNGPGTEARVLAFGDGWMPQCGYFDTVDDARTRITDLRHRAADLGQPEPSVTLFGVPHRRELIDQFADAGVDRCLLAVRETTETAMLDRLDELAHLNRH